MNETSTNNANSRKGGKIALVVAVVVIIGLVGAIGYLLGTRGGTEDQPTAEETTNRRSVVTPENVDVIVEEMLNQEYVEAGYYTVTQNFEWHFVDGTSPSYDATVHNVPENTNDVYFDVFLAGNEDKAIYESPVIPRGATLDQVTLNEKLEAGTYNCVMVYHLVDEEQNTLDTLRVELVIIVEG